MRISLQEDFSHKDGRSILIYQLAGATRDMRISQREDPTNEDGGSPQIYQLAVAANKEEMIRGFQVAGTLSKVKKDQDEIVTKNNETI